MKVYKFGGASVKNAEGVRNLAGIIEAEDERLFVIVSAMGKTTNALEKVLEAFYAGDTAEALRLAAETEEYHNGIVEGLWPGGHEIKRLQGFYAELRALISGCNPASRDYEAWYDGIVSYGELFSTAIISEFLLSGGVVCQWVDMRQVFITSSRHRDANIDIDRSAPLLLDAVNSSPARVFIGQGFIGATEDGATTTIGREGSDYSAAVAGYILDAGSVAIWKDVEGILNGDPKIFDGTTLIPELTYLDAIELAYSGAQIIHPKTIKPLQNKGIPLHVKCFLDKDTPGSVIKGDISAAVDTPILILKHDQVLMTIRPRDFSFVLEERFVQIFSLLEDYNAKVNLIQSSAVNLSICMDATRHLDEMIEALHGEGFRASYNTGMELLTVRQYTPSQLQQFGEGEEVYLTQRTRRTLRVVRKRYKIER